MDPNAALEEIRTIVRTVQFDGTLNPKLGRLTDLVIDLDVWLTNGGFHPRDWNHGGSDGSHQTR